MENNFCKRYNYSGLITDEDDLEIYKICKGIIDSGNYMEGDGRPEKTLTKENLFSLSDPVMLKLKMTFLTSVSLYLGKEVNSTNNNNAWGLILNSSVEMNGWDGWHNHLPLYPQEKIYLSGIYYAIIPDDANNYETVGTEFAPNGLDSSYRIFTSPIRKSWLIFSSSLYHRPGIILSEKDRVVIAADIQLDL